MESGALGLLDPHIFRRGQFITALMRWICLGAAFLALLALWSSPRTRPFHALAVGLAYGLYTLANQAWLRRHPNGRPAKIAHAVVDALAVGLGASFSGGIESPLW